MSVVLSPSILGGSFSNMENIISDINESDAQYIHIDVMDGDFVPNLTFGPKFISDIRQLSSKVFDVHLMINRVDRFLEDYIKAGSDIITFHIEVDENIEKNLMMIKKNNLKCGLAIKPKTSLKSVIQYLPLLDQIIIMTVEPGFGGQSFMEDQVHKIREIKEITNAKQLKLDIEVDGGIDDKTGLTCIKAGANILVAGSFLFKQNNLVNSTNTLMNKFINV